GSFWRGFASFLDIIAHTSNHQERISRYLLTHYRVSAIKHYKLNQTFAWVGFQTCSPLKTLFSLANLPLATIKISSRWPNSLTVHRAPAAWAIPNHYAKLQCSAVITVSRCITSSECRFR